MQSRIPRQIEPTLTFTLMKFALQVFEKKVVELTMEEYAEAYLQACHEISLQEKILLSEAACGVIIPNNTIQATFDRLKAEHGGDENFFHHLQRNNLQLTDYLTALHNDLKVETILARVAFHAEPVCHQELEDYYNNHPDSFCFPEQRSTRHIFISTENTPSQLPKDSLRRRIRDLHSRLQRDPQSFSLEAQLHSDCITAIDGGDLGRISPGDLCATLDHALFQLGPGEISPIIQTAQGFHILFCEAIHPGQRLTFQQNSQRIHHILAREKRITVCRNWIKSLFHNCK
ncbi:MAG: peptidylprolyl isomerase [Proteobacteria bacterium]|nr:peptidylprolyl isomerase [Pseudomonadota bacterium]MBU1648514.1 peptidylprolyl isomerase [Pseudomonadota bacterium]MBU1986819.1 peptidylprolyl isomerase [Pseudomonadota bacterium]